MCDERVVMRPNAIWHLLLYFTGTVMWRRLDLMRIGCTLYHGFPSAVGCLWDCPQFPTHLKNASGSFSLLCFLDVMSSCSVLTFRYRQQQKLPKYLEVVWHLNLRSGARDIQKIKKINPRKISVKSFFKKKKKNVHEIDNERVQQPNLTQLEKFIVPLCCVLTSCWSAEQSEGGSADAATQCDACDGHKWWQI